MKPVTQLVLDRLAPLTPTLDEAMASAILQAETRAVGLPHPKYPHLRPLTIRADVREALEAEPLPAGWSIGGDPRKMGQLLLKDEVSGIGLRVLKAPYTQPDQVPHAGRNPARREVWAQAPLPDLGDPSSLGNSVSLAGQTFLLIWSYVNAERRDEGYVLRIVHPREPGRYRWATLCDLDLLIPRGGLINEENLRFVGSDEDEELFEFDIPTEEEETGTE